MDQEPIILGIESSCDDTSAAVLVGHKLLSNVIASQAVHTAYGGVVPELASRAHEQNIVPVVSEAIRRAGITAQDLDAIAFTRGPGLLGSLLVGTNFAKGLSLSLGIPMVEVNHLHAHVLAHFIEEEGEEHQSPEFPFLCLLVSGATRRSSSCAQPPTWRSSGRPSTMLQAKLRQVCEGHGAGLPWWPCRQPPCQRGQSEGLCLQQAQRPRLRL